MVEEEGRRVSARVNLKSRQGTELNGTVDLQRMENGSLIGQTLHKMLIVRQQVSLVLRKCWEL